MKKKIISIILALTMVLGMVPFTGIPAFATDLPSGATGWVVDSGDNHVWYKLEERNTKLTIGGTGAMNDYNGAKNAPWYEDRKSIKTVVIESGVTHIGEDAFADGYYNALSSITIPSTVTSIGSAFASSSPISSLYIDSIESWCKISFISTSGNPLYGRATNKKLYVNGENVTNLVIPDTVTKINEYAFNRWDFLTSLTIPSSVTSIGNGAFTSCSNLASVTVKAKNAPTLEQAATFAQCANPLSIYVPAGSMNNYEGSSWNSISNRVFIPAHTVEAASTENGTVTVDKDWFPSDTYTTANETVTVTAIPDEGYALKSLVYNDGTKDYDITATKTFTMPTANVTVTAVFGTPHTHVDENKDFVCDDCGYEDRARAEAAGFKYENQGDNTILTGYEGEGTEIVIPGWTTVIGDGAFYENNGITKVTIPASVEKIGEGVNVFSDSSELESVTFEEDSKLKTIGGFAFACCEKLTDINLEDCKELETIGECAFEFTGFTSITIPASVNTIGYSAFQESEDGEGILESVTFEEGSMLKTIGSSAFHSCKKLAEINLEDCKELETIGDSAFYSCESLTEINLDACKELETIDSCAFEDTGLTSIHIPASVNTIGTSAFQEDYEGCGILESVIFEEGSKLKTIGSSAFQFCRSLAEINLDACKELETIGDCAFYICKSLTEIDLDACQKLVTIDSCAFYDTGLTLIHIPASVKEIGDQALCPSESPTDLYLNWTKAEDIVGFDFNGEVGTTTVHIPAGARSSYIGTCFEPYLPSHVVTLVNATYDGQNTFTYFVGEGGEYILEPADIDGKEFRGFVLDGDYEGVEITDCTLSIGDEVNADITVTAVYDTLVAVPAGIDPITYDGEEHTPYEETVGYTVDGDVTGKDVSEYTTTFTLEEGYVWDDDFTGEITWEIVPAAVTVKANDQSMPFGGDEPTLTYEITEGELAEGEELVGTLAVDGDVTQVGMYSIIQADDWDNPNYDITFDPGIFTVEAVKITVPTITGDKDNMFLYTGKEIKALESNDYYTVTDGSATATGKYTATVTLKDPDNYEWEDDDFDGEIEWYIVNAEYYLTTAPTTTEDGAYNQRAYYMDGDTKVTVKDNLLGEDQSIDFAGWYLRTMIQYKMDGDNYDIRFISMLNGECFADDKLADYESAGFIINIGGEDIEIKTTVGYTSFLADGKEISISDYSNSTDFFFLANTTFATADIDVDTEIKVTPFVKLIDGETTLKGNTASFTLSQLIKK